MILSFSVPAMLPYVEAGIRQAAGQDIGGARVKRQTIRKRGPQAERVFAWDPLTYTHPYDLHLWWKLRTPARRMLGVAEGGGYAYPIEIWHTELKGVATTRQLVRIDGPAGWRKGDPMLFWSPGAVAGSDFESEAYADGFDSPEAFRDYFVPNLGDRFDAILWKW